MERNVLPAVCGRVCPQEEQCEVKCTLGVKNEPVAIGRLERFVADYAALVKFTDDTPPAPPTGHKVAVVGSGPAGLTVAADLAKMGHGVTIFEALHKAGGVLVYGIPEFRLPKAIVEREIDGLKRIGVEIKTNHVIGQTFTVDELFTELGFEAVFIGDGRRPADVPEDPRHQPDRRLLGERVPDALEPDEGVPVPGHGHADHPRQATWPSSAAATPRWTPSARRCASAPRTPT